MYVRHVKRFQKGQVLPITVGLALLASVAIFMVLNSHRAVDEKMNLVNAADATAYSGAQMAARELNFMALTNRTMIANEVAIGHVMAYQTELDVIADALKNGPGGIIGTIISAFIALVGGDATVDNFNELNRIWSGAYILAMNASNAMYQDYQRDDYQALAGINRDSLLNAVMNTIAKQYVNSPDVFIEVNTSDALDQLESTGDANLKSVADAARTNPFCSAIMFAKPGGASGQTPFDPAGKGRFNGLDSECANYYKKGGSAPASLGALDNPVPDSNVLVQLLNSSATNATSADWVLKRDADYKNALGVSIHRKGTSSAVWDQTKQQINWKTNGNDTINTSGVAAFLWLSFHGQAAGNAKDIADDASSKIGGPVIALLKLAGLCGEIDCDALQNKTYSGVQRYAMLNPNAVDSAPMVTAVLKQNGNCNDDLGRHTTDGTVSDSWKDDLPAYNQIPVCSADKFVMAYAQAKVFYQRPTMCAEKGCTNGFDSKGVTDEKPNLFNPFWQARLATASVN